MQKCAMGMDIINCPHNEFSNVDVITAFGHAPEDLDDFHEAASSSRNMLRIAARTADLPLTAASHGSA